MMARALSTLFLLAAVGLAGWAVMLKQQLGRMQDAHIRLQSELAEKGEALTEAFAENRRLAMAQAGAMSDLEAARARTRELESKVEKAEQELAEAPAFAKNSIHEAFMRQKKQHKRDAIADFADMQITVNGKVLGGKKKNDERLEIDQLADFFTLKEEPLNEEQAAALRKLFEAEPDKTQTVTQTEDGNGFTVVMTEIGGTDDDRDARIREGAEKFLSEEQQAFLEIWQKKRGKRSFHAIQSFTIESKQTP